MQELYIGLMSGTSVDAIDAVLVRFDDDKPRLLAQTTLPWPAELRQRILALASGCDNELDEAGQLDQLIARQHAAAVRQLLATASRAPEEIIAIGLHGQTVRHRPRLADAFSCQLGDPNRLAADTGIMVACDFRRRDMAVGGQGAPLVPAFHDAVFRQPDQTVVAVNLGGIANITVLVPGQAALGYDTGPANMLMDAWCQRHQGRSYDHNGDWARSGQVVPSLLTQLLAHPYFQLPPPKSTGREEFGLAWLAQALAGWEAQHAPLPAADVQATLMALTVHSVSAAIRQTAQQGLVVLCGGGAFNRHLVSGLQAELPGWTLADSQAFGIAPQWVEASAFAWLARQLVHGRPGNLPSVTGARTACWLGGLYPGALGFRLPGRDTAC